ncbi:hypothetical protein J3R30DRAFT_3438806 [Lentinula aciculospora]|uniref:SAP domain-containing protein n=1 Tax=Lentinula aciculospora TaxID=153920 RepID=A0A9W9DTP9_9AGAR|nr:hypothetical protein J3R30DRAFT_3438806 [Lentinula aciculospora]
MENFDIVFDSVKAETLRSLVRDLGQKGNGKRDDMLDFLKNRLFNDGQTTTTRSMSIIQKGSAARKTLSAPGPSRKRKAEAQEESNADSVEDGDNDSPAKRTRTAKSNVVDLNEDSISAAPRRGRRPAIEQSSSKISPRRVSARTRILTTKAAAGAEMRNGRGRPRQTASALSREEPDGLSDADADGDDDEYVEETEEDPPIQRRGRGRPRKHNGIKMQSAGGVAERGQAGADVPLKRSRVRPRKDQGTSASAPVPRTLVTRRLSLSPASERLSVSPHPSHAPMSTRSRTGHSPAKKTKSYITAPLVQRTYGRPRKGGVRPRGRPPKAAAAAAGGRKPRSSVSKPGTHSRTKYIPARSKAKGVSDRSSASGSGSGKKYTFAGVELVSRNRGRQSQDAGALDAEAGPSGGVDVVGDKGGDVDADGDTDMDLLGGGSKGNEGQLGLDQSTSQQSLTSNLNHTSYPASNLKDGLGHEAATFETPSTSGLQPRKESPRQPENQRGSSLFSHPSSASAPSLVNSPIIVVPPTLSLNGAGDSSSSYLPLSAGAQIEALEDVILDADQKMENNLEDQEIFPELVRVQNEHATDTNETSPTLQLSHVASSSKSVLGDIHAEDGDIIEAASSASGIEQNAPASTIFIEDIVDPAATVILSDSASASNSTVSPPAVAQNVFDEDINTERQVGADQSQNEFSNDHAGNSESEELDSVDDDDTNIMDPPIGHTIEVEVHTEKTIDTSAAMPADKLREGGQGLVSTADNEFAEKENNDPDEPSTSAVQLSAAPVSDAVQLSVSIASLHSLHSRPAEDDTADNELFESTYLDDFDLEMDEGEIQDENATEIGNATLEAAGVSPNLGYP